VSDVSPEAREAADNILDGLAGFLPNHVMRQTGLKIASAVTRALAAQKSDLICTFCGHAVDGGANKEKEALGLALNQYGRHFRSCLGVGVCCCGLDAAITTPNYQDELRVAQEELARLREENERLTRERDEVARLANKVEEVDRLRNCALEDRIATLERQVEEMLAVIGGMVKHTYDWSGEMAPFRARASALLAATAATNEGGSNE
jgi:hypothetical protein